MALKHTFVSSIADSTDSTLVRPSNWNADHTLSGVGTTSILFESGGSISGDTGLTYTTPGQATFALGTITSNAKALNITGTFNSTGVTFDAPLFMNITTTAMANSSLLLDLQTGGVSAFKVPAPTASGLDLLLLSLSATTNANGFRLNNTTLGSEWFIEVAGNTATMGISTGLLFYDNFAGKRAMILQGAVGLLVSSQMFVGWASSASPNIADVDTKLYRDAAAQTLALGNATNAQALRIYNTTDQTATGTAPTNFERASINWSSNTLFIAMEKGGTGTGRAITILTPASNGPITLGVNNNTSGHVALRGGNQFDWTLSSDCTVSWTNSGGNANGSMDTGINRASAGVITINGGDPALLSNATGWLNYGGQARVSANSTTTSTAMANVPGLAFKPQGSRNYSFEAHLIFTDAAAGGIQCTINATSTTTTYTLTFDGWVTDTTAVRAYAQGSAFGNVVASSLTTGTIGHVTITGTLMTSATAPSTVSIQFAQNTSNATPTTVLIGSYMWTHDMP